MPTQALQAHARFLAAHAPLNFPLGIHVNIVVVTLRQNSAQLIVSTEGNGDAIRFPGPSLIALSVAQNMAPVMSEREDAKLVHPGVGRSNNMPL